MSNQTEILPYADVILKLLKGVLESDDPHWKKLEEKAKDVAAYFQQIGLKLYLDKEEGYAYLEQPDDDLEDDKNGKLPRLVKRLPLSYELTILSVILREELQRFDIHNRDSTRCVLSKQEIYDLMEPFFPVQTNDIKRLKKLDSAINKATDEMGILKLVKSADNPHEETYEVRRIIKAKIPAEKLNEIKEKLKQYAVKSN